MQDARLVRSVASIAWLALAWVGCGGSPPSPSAAVPQGVIIGNNDLVAVSRDGSNVPAKYRPLLDGVGRLHIPRGLCTATYVGSNIAISAGHCFEGGETRQDHTPCPGTFVEWGYR